MPDDCTSGMSPKEGGSPERKGLLWLGSVLLDATPGLDPGKGKRGQSMGLGITANT